jgi:hypothetical protein
MKGETTECTTKDIMKKYPCITAHIIAESLGYATPSRASAILKDARDGKENYCEWIYSCYGGDPKKAVQNAIRNRHHHEGYMAEYKLAMALVKRAIEKDDEPIFASWF